MVKIFSTNQIKHIAELAKLEITEKEVQKLSRELSDTLDFIDKVKKIPAENFDPTSHVSGFENVYREDIIIPSLSQQEALSQSSNAYRGYFKVKAVLEE